MPYTNAQKQQRARDKRARTWARWEAALSAIAGGCTMPAQTASHALNPEKNDG